MCFCFVYLLYKYFGILAYCLSIQSAGYVR